MSVRFSQKQLRGKRKKFFILLLSERSCLWGFHKKSSCRCQKIFFSLLFDIFQFFWYFDLLDLLFYSISMKSYLPCQSRMSERNIEMGKHNHGRIYKIMRPLSYLKNVRKSAKWNDGFVTHFLYIYFLHFSTIVVAMAHIEFK